MKIALIDDDRLVSSLLKSFFDQQDNIEVEILAENGKDFINKLNHTKSKLDLIISDLRMDEMNGIELLEYIKKQWPNLKVIILSSFYKDTSIGFMLKAGVDAFQPKGILPSDLLFIVKEVYHRGHYFSPDQMNIIRDQLPASKKKKNDPSLTSLTMREKEILELICQQKTAKEIAEKLFINYRTVEGHKNNILLKLDVKNTAGLIIKAVKNRLIDTDNILL